MVDHGRIGFALAPFTVVAEAERVRRFAEAIGDSAPTGKGMGVPLTFLKALEGEHNSSRLILDALGVDLKSVLHAEQQFDYLAPLRVGEAITVERRVHDIYDKREGAIQFIVIESLLSGAAGTLAARSRQVLMVRGRAQREAA